MNLEEIIKGIEWVNRKYSASVMGLPDAEECEDIVALRAAIAQLKARPDAPPNDPLTLEELRGMGKDWVWIELLVPLYRMDTGYFIKHPKFSDADKFCCGYPDHVVRDLPYSLYEDTWRAYRRRPEAAP